MSQSPSDARPKAEYEGAWAAITSLIEGEESWSGRERNLCYLNAGDGSFADISAAAGLDFLDDGRAFATGDLDADGDLDLVLKSRNEPGIRLVRNDWRAGGSVAVRLRGNRANRDGAGAWVTVRLGAREIEKAVRFGSGFLSQHSKDLHFGVGAAERIDELRIHWASGAESRWTELPVNRRYRPQEGSDRLPSEAFARISVPAASDRGRRTPPPAPETAGTWLVEPVPAPPWSLIDIAGRPRALADFRGRPLALNIWATWCPPCRTELRDFQRNLARFQRAGLQLAAVSADEPSGHAAVSDFVRAEGLGFPTLIADEAFATAYNVLKRHLLPRRTDLRIPTTFLVNRDGFIERIYEGPVESGRLLRDLKHLGEPAEARLARALPFAGRYFGPRPARDYAGLGAVLLSRGLPGAALPYFEADIARTPGVARSHFNLGTAQSQHGDLHAARTSFERALELDLAYPEARNSLGAILARLGEHDAAIDHFRAALAVRPGYEKAVGNLATAYLNTDQPGRAIEALESALAAAPHSAGLRNRLGTLHAQRGALDAARDSFREALRVAPGNPDAQANLALLEAQRGNLAEAAAQLSGLLRKRPGFERAYVDLAQVCTAAGDSAGAREALQRLLARNPGHSAARRRLEQLGE